VFLTKKVFSGDGGSAYVTPPADILTPVAYIARSEFRTSPSANHLFLAEFCLIFSKGVFYFVQKICGDYSKKDTLQK
jgi:hypothetical protein